MFGFFKKKKPLKTAVNHSTSSRRSDGLEKRMAAIEAAVAEIKEAIMAGSDESDDDYDRGQTAPVKQTDGHVMSNGSERVIEGVFDGQNMIGSDGQQYDIPANYASKSKLVEGDILKLTINNLGAFLYKQIKPIERSRMVGDLEQDEHSLQYYVVAEGKKWRLLTASVTYFKGEPGDEVVFFIPRDGGSRWAAVENIVKK
ncbi:hypothetical protein COT97_04155 [Candidatus Falkowbacteria bacterium CG10_big_fil_rev_8_21_14_0_10_39_11]|uniref:50S ribosomal protein L7/L12 n=1 Tax=Candidatus Falkowbacteria bacterium CG10_big_fil_rev_8_21_14_0_10_39_11 TaxID=1974565 RepID=A0A2H0V6D4_9BACT|nr:MAG: hypothetical protein COT97_04155 [Candidatus Falkowbacteria bacterium CG10_big_fil_rev_8_21_14_0_10_39_11]